MAYCAAGKRVATMTIAASEASRSRDHIRPIDRGRDVTIAVEPHKRGVPDDAEAGNERKEQAGAGIEPEKSGDDAGDEDGQ